MILLPDEKLFTNKFVEVVLPSKAQIFARTGQRSVAPAGYYTGDDSVQFNPSNIDQAEAVASAAESMVNSSDES